MENLPITIESLQGQFQFGDEVEFTLYNFTFYSMKNVIKHDEYWQMEMLRKEAEKRGYSCDVSVDLEKKQRTYKFRRIDGEQKILSEGSQGRIDSGR